MNYLEIATRNAEEHDMNVQNFMMMFGCHPNEVIPFLSLIRQQEENFFSFYAKYLESSTSSTLR